MHNLDWLVGGKQPKFPMGKILNVTMKCDKLKKFKEK